MEEEQRLGTDHPTAVATRYKLASALQNTGKLDRALEQFYPVLVVFEKVYNPTLNVLCDVHVRCLCDSSDI